MKIAIVNDSIEKLGIEYISSVLKTGGHEVKLFIDPQLFDDENISIKWLSRKFSYKKRIVNDLKNYNPDLIGISVVTDFYQWACRMAKLIKGEMMDIPIIFGGIHPTSVPERVMKNDFVDMVCVGEGEYPMLELADSMKKGKIDYSIKNIWFKKGSKIIKNEMRFLIGDLDSLPFADKGLYYAANSYFSHCYYIMASRGCNYACSYCCHSYLRKIHMGKGIYLRRRSVRNVINELILAKEKYDLKYIRFFDDSLGVDIKWLEGFTSLYKETISLPFICYMHPKDISVESVKYLKGAGCCEIEIGIQSGTERIRRDILKRDTSDQTIERAINLIQKEKISLVTDNIFGLPQEGGKDIIDLAIFYNKKRVSRVYFFWLRFYPKIALTEWAKEIGLLSDERYENIMNGEDGVPFSRGGNINNKSLIKLQLLFFLLPFLPRFCVNLIIKYNIYKYIPVFYSPAILAVFTSLFSPSFYDHIIRKRGLWRYYQGVKNLVFKGNEK